MRPWRLFFFFARTYNFYSSTTAHLLELSLNSSSASRALPLRMLSLANSTPCLPSLALPATRRSAAVLSNTKCSTGLSDGSSWASNRRSVAPFSEGVPPATDRSGEMGSPKSKGEMVRSVI